VYVSVAGGRCGGVLRLPTVSMGEPGMPQAACKLANGDTVGRYKSDYGDWLCPEYILRFDLAKILPIGEMPSLPCERVNGHLAPLSGRPTPQVSLVDPGQVPQTL
jgi:hypothetical protein